MNILEDLFTDNRKSYKIECRLDNKTSSSRTSSHDFRYEGDNGYVYYDSYLGGECFASEEAVCLHKNPVL